MKRKKGKEKRGEEKERKEKKRRETHTWKCKWATETILGETPALDFLDKDVKVTILDMLEELKQNTAKELNENMKQYLNLKNMKK